MRKRAYELNLTGGEWTLEPGSSGFSGSREEPPEPAYPPTVVTGLEGSDGKWRDFVLATGGDTNYIADLPEDAEPEEILGSERWEGDPNDNLQVMAAAKDLFEALELARPYVEKARHVAGDSTIDLVLFQIDQARSKAWRGGENS